jgi:hypothetical protein
MHMFGPAASGCQAAIAARERSRGLVPLHAKGASSNAEESSTATAYRPHKAD